jgi:predicted TPR repeat methyltransferase
MTRKPPHHGAALTPVEKAVQQAQSALQHSRFAQAESLCRAALQKAPRAAPLHMLLAAALHAQGDLDAAIKTMTCARGLNPRNPEPASLMARWYWQANELDQALVAIDEAVTLATQDAQLRFLRAQILQAMGRSQASIQAYQEVIALAPQAAEAACNIASVWMHLGNMDEALAWCDRALLMRPGFLPALHNRALATDRHGQLLEAIEAYQAVLAQDPTRLDALQALARLYTETGAQDEAVAIHRRVLAQAPEDALTAHALAALDGRAPSAAPAAFVRGVFDSMASDFDRHLVQDLHYTLPQVVAAWWARQLASPPSLRLLDLGCGTGLLVRALRTAGVTCEATGVDLVPSMIEVAQSHGLYRSLACSAIDRFLAPCSDQFDGVALLDVLIYTGDPAPTLAAIHRLLTGNGRVIFSVEHAADSRRLWQLHTTGRYQHGLDALRVWLAENGYQILHHEPIDVRLERGQPIRGSWFVCGHRQH